jgi:NADH-quinone oxidoreductase subunit N
MLANQFFLLMRFELLIAVILFILLFIKIGTADWPNQKTLALINILLLVNFVAGLLISSEGTLFGDMFRTGKWIEMQKNLLNLATLIISAQAYSWLINHKHVLEFYMLLLSALLGMFFMISAGNFLMFYLGLELATIPIAAICNFDLEKRQSSEAAMKLIISSAFSSGLLLFGISLVYGTTGTLNFAALSQHLNGSSLQLFAFILLLTGFSFKISIVPFHFWTADVYEGAPVSVTAFLSVVSKAAFLFVLISVLFTVFRPLGDIWYYMLYILSILSMTVGNLFALRQNNLKRFLAFSSITQMGFILVGISGGNRMGSTSVVYFLLIYIFSNLGAFAVISLVSALTGLEKLDDYKGFYKTNPFLTWVLTLSLFSLAGIPPTAGFFGKFFLIMAGAEKGNYLLITIAALNMIISLYYYLKIVRTMFMEDSPQPIEKLVIHGLPKFAMLLCIAGIVLVGFIPAIYTYIYSLSFGAR